MQPLLLALIALVSTASAGDTRQMSWPLGPAPARVEEPEMPPDGNALRALGVPSRSMSSTVYPLPFAPTARIPAWIRVIESTQWNGAFLQTRQLHTAVVRGPGGEVYGAMDEPMGWEAARGTWALRAEDSAAAAWVLATLHLNSCVDLDRHRPAWSPDRQDRAEEEASPPRIRHHESGPSTLRYSWWSRGGKPAVIEVVLDGSAACPARLRRGS